MIIERNICWAQVAKVSDLLRMDERATRMRERTSLLEREEEEEEVWYCCDFMDQEGSLFYVGGFSVLIVLAEIMIFSVYLFSTAPVFS